MATSSSFSAYEVARAQNIERNNARLRALGLITISEEQTSNHSAWNRDLGPTKAKNNPKDKSKKRLSASTSRGPPTRRSKRLKEAEGSCSSNADSINGSETMDRQQQEEESHEQRVRNCREARQRAALKLQASDQNKNPTATYDHCLMRVRTMTTKSLANRVKVIERAAGKHCVVKMAIFKSCLQDEGQWQLAQLASEALERLKALQAPPVDDE